ncbi:MAG: rod-binding protein [Treponema sp.]|jgi:flagellar protein FlgJ|nr:rod-binding protein [Treponema sp.]
MGSQVNPLNAGNNAPPFGAGLPAGAARLRAEDARGGFADLLEQVKARPANPAGTEKAAALNGPLITTFSIDKNSKLYEQCEALETFLVKNLLSGMRATVQKTGLIDTGFAGEVYEDMLWDEYAKEYTKNADFGLAELAYLELTNQRGKVPPV